MSQNLCLRWNNMQKILVRPHSFILKELWTNNNTGGYEAEKFPPLPFLFLMFPLIPLYRDRI